MTEVEYKMELDYITGCNWMLDSQVTGLCSNTDADSEKSSPQIVQ